LYEPGALEPTVRDYRALCEDGQRLEREGRFSDARLTYEHAINGEERYPDVASTSTVLRWIARSYQAEARFDEALDCLEAAYACAEADGDEQAYGHAQNLHAIIWWQQGISMRRGASISKPASALRNGDTFLARP
jgi:tetratricopeptide (TPR) repeat protein